jgi:hypothetical protein
LADVLIAGWQIKSAASTEVLALTAFSNTALLPRMPVPSGSVRSNQKWRVEVQKRKGYSAPRLIAHGSVEKITKGFSVGFALDATFPRGTPITDVTFT